MTNDTMMMDNTPEASAAPRHVEVAGRGGWPFLSLLRIAIGFIFLWAFLDKLFGLGFSTCRDRDTGDITVGCDAAWIHGSRITEGYLGSSTGPFADFFANLGTQAWTDWPFMLGLAGIGLALMLGIGTRIAMWAGILMLSMMYISHSWPNQGGNTTNPFIDEHIIEILAIVACVQLELARQSIGLGKWWRGMGVVQKNRWLI
ncbi:DoxX family protein [Demequina aurantiaca]|uniref:DoxX family protein n=1 Tax=Demequina aurantiaca TaxID=676200 RepID=UPI0007849BF5|nr:DoxX family protein [Demequina aurantiaca]